MKSGVNILICAICLLVSACAAQPTQEVGSNPQSDEGGGARVGEASLPNFLVQAEGEVLLRRSGWSNFIPAGFGTVVAPGDLLRLVEGATAVVFCGDEGEWDKGTTQLTADGAEHGVPCTSGQTPRPWLDVVALRAESEADLPYIISPRNTALLSERPDLEWHPLEGVNTFTLTLIGDDGLERQPLQVKGNQLEWPEGWPPLQPEASYVLTVDGGGKRSDAGAQGTVGLGFWMLSDKEVGGVRQQKKHLQAANLGSQAKDLLTAELYMRHKLRAEAIQLFQSLADSSGSPAIWLALGRAYLEMGLPMQAHEAFAQALAFAQDTGEREVEAAALVGSGLASRLLNDVAAAAQALQAAKDMYSQIGDQQGIEQAERMLSE